MMDFQDVEGRNFGLIFLQSRKLPGRTEKKVEVTIRGSYQTDQFPRPMNVTIRRLRLSRTTCLNFETFSDLPQTNRQNIPC
jgi:hypothetical protein